MGANERSQIIARLDSSIGIHTMHDVALLEQLSEQIAWEQLLFFADHGNAVVAASPCGHEQCMRASIPVGFFSPPPNLN